MNGAGSDDDRRRDDRDGRRDRRRNERRRNGRRGRDDEEETPLEQVASGVAVAVTLLVAFGLLALGYSFFWVAFPIGFGGLLPAAIAFARYYEGRREERREAAAPTDAEAALATLRDRYARGEIDEAEFERRVERLLRTESVADADDYLEEVRRDRQGETPPGDERATDRVADAELERERELEREWNRDRRE